MYSRVWRVGRSSPQVIYPTFWAVSKITVLRFRIKHRPLCMLCKPILTLIVAFWESDCPSPISTKPKRSKHTQRRLKRLHGFCCIVARLSLCLFQCCHALGVKTCRYNSVVLCKRYKHQYALSPSAAQQPYGACAVYKSVSRVSQTSHYTRPCATSPFPFFLCQGS